MAKAKKNVVSRQPKTGNVNGLYLARAGKGRIDRVGAWPKTTTNPAEFNTRIREWIGGRYTVARGVVIEEDGILCTVQFGELQFMGFPRDVSPIHCTMLVVEDALQHPEDFEVNEMATEAQIAAWMLQGMPLQRCAQHPPLLGDAILEIPEVWTELKLSRLSEQQVRDAVSHLQYGTDDVFFEFGATSHKIYVRDPQMATMFALALKLPVR